MKRLPEHIERWLSFRFYREIGIAALIGMVLPLIVGTYIYFNPIETSRIIPEEQAFDVKATAVKFNTVDFHAYLDQISQNNGVLVLGTSETGNMGGLNYFDLLNADPDIDRKFSRLGGAGRFFEIYMPLIEASPEAWEGVEIMAFVNPTYWRIGLNSFQPQYFNRYVDKRLAFEHRDALKETGAWDDVYSNYFSASNPTQLYASGLERKVEGLRDLFAVQLRSLYKEPEDPFMPFEKIPPLPDSATLLSYIDLIDTTYNVSHAYREHRDRMWYPKCNVDSDFRNHVLSSFIETCQQHNIKLTMVLGSYNGVMAAACRPPEDVEEYDQLLADLRVLIQDTGVDFVDVSETSYVRGSYRDYQHHSKYGAYLKYLILKEHYETP